MTPEEEQRIKDHFRQTSGGITAEEALASMRRFTEGVRRWADDLGRRIHINRVRQEVVNLFPGARLRYFKDAEFHAAVDMLMKVGFEGLHCPICGREHDWVGDVVHRFCHECAPLLCDLHPWPHPDPDCRVCCRLVERRTA